MKRLKHIKLYENFMDNFIIKDLKLTRFEFEEFREFLYNFLVEEMLIEDSDEIYSEIDDYLGNGEYLVVNWEEIYNDKNIELNEIDKDLFIVFLKDFIKKFNLEEKRDYIINYILENTFLNLV